MTTTEAEERKLKCTDPFTLPEVAVDKILGYLDTESLLTCRQVRQGWNTTISQRGMLWRKRCELSFVHSYAIDTCPGTGNSYMYLYLSARRVLNQMYLKENLEMENYDGSTCCLHSYVKSCRVLPNVDVGRNERNVNGTWLCIKVTNNFELVCLKQTTGEVVWRTERHNTSLLCRLQGSVFTVTLSGDIEVYSTGGALEATVNTGGKLSQAKTLIPHRSRRAMLVEHQDGMASFVNRHLHVFPLDVPAPNPSHLTDPCISLLFGDTPDLGEDRLPLLLQRKRSRFYAVIDSERGAVLQSLHLDWDWCVPVLSGQERVVVGTKGGELLAHDVCIEDSGVISQRQVWKRPLPARLVSSEDVLLMAGKSFLVALRGLYLDIYRLDRGCLVLTLDSCYEGQYSSDRLSCDRCKEEGNPAAFYDALIKTILNTSEDDPQNQSACLYFIDSEWLDGLSPSTTPPDIPLVVAFSPQTLWATCVRWSHNLWDNLPGDVSSE